MASSREPGLFTAFRDSLVTKQVVSSTMGAAPAPIAEHPTPNRWRPSLVLQAPALPGPSTRLAMALDSCKAAPIIVCRIPSCVKRQLKTSTCDCGKIWFTMFRNSRMY
ncbi:hypothetical protein M747DRAFT_353642 [Aspergillus niger ATCC 13496]|uniref:Uncharacterized protein n=1 Tax=Aspergillus niger ATCC 13496 TaxID=1353008 RepID=A0A370C130_ASPNG|nr:hypothetical protein M747DRAFT_353642 [Aspergillus niger ATCC 13496]